MKTTVYLVLTILVFFAISSCKPNSSKTNENKQVKFSKDLDLLAQYIDLSVFKPEKVNFKLTTYHNESNDRFSIPGPSDYEIQALLYFDEATFITLKNAIDKKDLQNEVLKYDWFPQEIKHEIETWKIKPYSYRDTIFKSPNGRIMLLHNKLIITFYST